MKIIFILDDDSVVVATPAELSLVQVKEGTAALAVSSGKNEDGEDTFTALVTYPVNLLPYKSAEEPVVEGAVDGPDGII